MKKYIIILLLISNSAFAQNDYNQIIREAISIVENNYVSFEDRLKNKESEYLHLKANLLADTLVCSSDFLKNLKIYVSFFKDNHLRLADKYMYESTKLGSDTLLFKSDVINSNTTYLKIGSFAYKSNINRLIKKATDVDSMNHRKNLIIDLRGNGGGDNRNFQRLLQFIATNTIYIRNSKLLVTPENWQCHKKREHLGDFNRGNEGKLLTTPWSNTTNYLVLHYKPYCVYDFPKRVAVLVDRDTGSAAEQFVFCAKQSLKVKIFGENTNGTVDNGYLNSFELIKDKLYINYATVKKIDSDQNEVYNRGIAPDFYLNRENQIEEILKYFRYWD